jgi:DNA polymerase (family 10)
MPSHNAQLERLFQQMADALELTGANRFRVVSFQRAARVLGELTEDVADLSPSELTAIDGIGKGTAERIAEYLESGKIEEHQQVVEQVPQGLFKVLDIPGLGPKTVKQLWDEAQVTDIETLKAALRSGKLEKLKGFGKKKIENIEKNLAFAETAGQRTRLGTAMPLAEAVVEYLRQLEGVKQCAYAGSLRRGKETIGDIDILVAAPGSDAPGIIAAFVGMDIVADVIAQGGTKASIRANETDGAGMQIDLRVIPQASFGAAMLYFTGSKEHNVRLRERAQTMGWTLNEYALKEDKEDGKVIARKTEADIYDALKLAPIAPELREDRGEIALAEKDELPGLIELDDVIAELHTHTTASDGIWSIRELAEACAERGFHTVAVTDHSKGQAQANGLDAKRLEKHIKAVREVAEAMKDDIVVLGGSEVDILASGELDYDDDLLAELDLVVASPHAALSQDPDKATKRLLDAIEHPSVSIIGHATGRLIGRREGLSPDMGKLFEAGAKRGIAFEINANHYRLDLRDTHARAALKAGCKLSINTDAHGPADLDQLRYGVLTARRAGATRDDVINCLSKTKLAKWIKSTRG